MDSRETGLPNYPKSNRHLSEQKNRLEIVSINYDYIDSAVDSPRMFFVELLRPPPSDFNVRIPVKIVLRGNIIRTSLGEYNGYFYVSDIIGTKVILLPYRTSLWNPAIHSAGGWGYTLLNLPPDAYHHNITYGYGQNSDSYIEYSDKVSYSDRASQRDRTLLKDSHYRITKTLPGWDYFS